MSDIIDINEKLKNKGGIIIVPPPNPSPKRVFKKKISLNQIEPYIDPGLEELLNFPVRVPHLKREIRKAQQENPIEKEIDLLKRYREKPLLFWRDELGVSIDIWRDDKPPKSWEFGDPVPLWSKQREIIQALIDYRKVSVKSGHGVGKCRGFEDYILLADGSWKKAKDLIGRTFFILSYKDGKQVVKRAWAEDNGIKKCLKISYKDGNEEIVTLNHPLWATKRKGISESARRWDKKEDGFRKAQYLEVGDCVASPIKINIEGKELLDDRMVKFLAYVIGDGCLTSQVSFSQENNKQLREFRNIVQSYNCSLTYRGGYDYQVVGRKGFFVNIVKYYGLYGKNSFDKFVPDEVMMSSDRQVVLFLSRLFSTDGWIHFKESKLNEKTNRTYKNYQIGYSSGSLLLIKQVQYLLKRLGISSTIRSRFVHWTYKEIKKSSFHHELWIANKQDILDFDKKIKIFGKEDKQLKLIEFIQDLNDKQTQKWKRRNISFGFEWNEISKIESTISPTVSIQVEDTNTFITPFSYEHNTFLMGGLTLYLGIVWHATGMTTAPTFRQVRRALWGEIHYQYNRALNPLGGKLNQTSLDLGDKWFVEGFATDKPTENITGIHEENIFVIVDEAGGVAPETFEALDALVTSESSFVIYIGNPTSSDGPFYDSFKPKSGFKNFTISCYDCPNVKHDRVIYSKLTSKKWVDEKEKKWGITSPLFLVRVKGEFADQSTDTLIPIKYIEIALNKGKEENLKLTKVLSFGLDVARQGSDNSVYGVCYEIKDRPETFFKIIDRTQRIRETVTAGKMKGIYDELVPEFKQKGSLNLYNKYKIMELEEGEGKKEKDDLQIFPPINIDEINAGGGVSDIMIEDEYPVNEINVSEPPDKSDFEAVGLFLNKRAKYYWNLKMLFEAELVIIDDEDLANELSKFRFEQLRSGKIKIVDKDEIKAELNGKSPDDAETMMLCYSEKEGRNTQDLVHFI